jgi:predicted DNA-binding transcriptional regulator AlpA
MRADINLPRNDISTNRRLCEYVVRGLNRQQAAHYIGITASLFDDLIEEGRLPKPIRIKRRTVWDIRQLDEAFDDLGNCDSNSWDGMLL